MNRRGFTVVEMIITVTIMGILLLLAVVNVNTSQVKARDDERRTDVEAIAANLESFFNIGTDNTTSFGRYPSTGLVGTEATIKTTLRDADIEAFLAPGETDVELSFVASTNTGTSSSIQTPAGVLPQPTIGQYVYQPIKTDGSLCLPGDTDCRKFNIFYRLESDDVVYKITSKNQ